MLTPVMGKRHLLKLRLCMQTLVPEAGDRDHNVCKDGVAPGMSLSSHMLAHLSCC